MAANAAESPPPRLGPEEAVLRSVTLAVLRKSEQSVRRMWRSVLMTVIVVLLSLAQTSNKFHLRILCATFKTNHIDGWNGWKCRSVSKVMSKRGYPTRHSLLHPPGGEPGYLHTTYVTRHTSHATRGIERKGWEIVQYLVVVRRCLRRESQVLRLERSRPYASPDQAASAATGPKLR